MKWYWKIWVREAVVNLLLLDGHKLRIVLEVRQPDWAVYPERHPDFIAWEGAWDGVVESRIILMHDDWPDIGRRLLRDREWYYRGDYDENHVNGLAWLIERLGERSDEVPPLLCSEFIQAFENMLEGIFSHCAFFLPDEDFEDFPAYQQIYLEPAIEWLLGCTPETFEEIPFIRD